MSFTKKRRCDKSYLSFGFTVLTAGRVEKPQCVLCSEVLAASLLKPNGLKRHLEMKHPSAVNKDKEFFRHQADRLVKSRFDDMGMCMQDIAASLKASYEVSRKIAAAKSLITLESNKMFNYVAIKIDETTDVTDLAQLCVYVHYMHNKHLEDEFLFCETLNTRTTANDIFQKVDQFFNTYGIKWEHVVGMCTDSAPAMLGCRSGFQTMVKEKFPNTTGTHCTLHHQAFMIKTMPNHMRNVLNDVVKAVNFIKANSLNSRLFADLCKVNGSNFEMLLLYSHVRWLSKGIEIHKFLCFAQKELHRQFSKTRFLICLSFLVDIFESVNSVNLALQGKDITVVHCHEKIIAFKMKLHLWHFKLACENFAPFPNLKSILDEDCL
uniref:Uncharacterized protein n=1 Tax=Octopus bimaculoides TaxID=37653 RepID=A0A0L8FG49_OCTBM